MNMRQIVALDLQMAGASTAYVSSNIWDAGGTERSTVWGEGGSK